MAVYTDVQPQTFHVIHPLDDAVERKHSPDGLGLMRMNPSVKYSLMALRGYLILMFVLVGFKFITLAGFFGQSGGH